MERKLAAIFSADVQGYSRLMGDDEEATIRTLTAYREMMSVLIQQHHGRVVDSPGNNLLAEFGSAVDAVQGAIEIQKVLKTKNAELSAARQMHYRIGINVGDVVIEDERIYGDGVNIAARLESLAEGGGISISGTVYDQIANKLDLHYEYQGEQAVKNIAQSVRVYRVELESLEAGSTAERRGEVTSPLPLPDKPSIAVLPFTNMSNDPEQEYFSDGITEDLITDLSQISGLFVIARNSVFTYKGQAVKIEQVQRELGVRYVLEGSIRKAGNRVRITAQLVEAATGGHVWAQRYDRQLDDIFALQDEVTQQIVSALEVKLTKGEAAQLERNATENVEAYDSYLRGVDQFNLRTQAGNIQARQLFEQAIAIDPDYAAAYAYLSRTYISEWANGWSYGPHMLKQAMELGQKAARLADTLPLAHLALGFAHLWQRQHEQAIAEAERAMALNPNDAECYGALADILNYAGQPQEAIPLLEKAQRLDPHYPAAYLFNLGRAYYLLEQNDEAIAAFRRALTRNPDHLSAHAYLAGLYIEKGQEVEAKAEMAEVLQLSPGMRLDNLGRAPYKDPAVTERILIAFRKAGLKE